MSNKRWLTVDSVDQFDYILLQVETPEVCEVGNLVQIRCLHVSTDLCVLKKVFIEADKM